MKWKNGVINPSHCFTTLRAQLWETETGCKNKHEMLAVKRDTGERVKVSKETERGIGEEGKKEDDTYLLTLTCTEFLSLARSLY